MQILPAIDILEGRVVRLRQGGDGRGAVQRTLVSRVEPGWQVYGPLRTEAFGRTIHVRTLPEAMSRSSGQTGGDLTGPVSQRLTPSLMP